MDLYVKVEANHCDELQHPKQTAMPQIRYLQAGECATPITWKLNGTGKITNLHPSSSTLLPITLMAQTDGLIDNHGLSSQYIDCFKTFHVMREDAGKKTIMHEMQHGNINLKVTLSPFADFKADSPLQQYKSDVVENMIENINKGNVSIKTCISMLTTGITLPQAKSILSGQAIEIDESKRALIQNLRYALLESDTKASTGLQAMHHTVVTRTLDRVQAKLPINLQKGFFLLLQARKYCQDAKIPIKAENVQGLQSAARSVLQYQSALNNYKFDTTLGRQEVEFGNKVFCSMDKQTDIQHATVSKMAAHAMFDHEQMEESIILKRNLSQNLETHEKIGDCEDLAQEARRLALSMQAPHQLVNENKISLQICQDTIKGLLFDQAYTCSVPELEVITHECMLISGTLYDKIKINPCIGLAGAANMSQETNTSNTPQITASEHDIGKMLASGLLSGHCWGLDMQKDDLSPAKVCMHTDSGCKVTVRIHKGSMNCYEGTATAFTDPSVKLNQNVQFKFSSEMRQSATSAAFEKKICALNNKVMPQFMAISLASNIHQAFIADAYQFCAKAVATQPPVSHFYQGIFAVNDDDCACMLFQTTKQNAALLHENPSPETLSLVLQKAKLGYIPAREGADTVNLLLQVEPMDPAYHLALDTVSTALATRILPPEQEHAHYEQCMQRINQIHGTNMPLTPYAVDLMQSERMFPEIETLKFIARTNKETVEKMVENKTIKNYLSLSPFAHICSL